MKVYQSVRRGFTLLELMVVVAIIAVLLGILLPMVSHVRKAAQGAATSSQLAAIATAIQQYYGDFKAYPGPLPNSQVGLSNHNPIPPSPSIIDPTQPSPFPIQLGTTTGGVTNYAAFPIDGTGIKEEQEITGAENLVLGLLGGLELSFNAAGTLTNFGYNPANIFPDGTIPSPKGAMSLNPTQPKRYAAYMQVRPGEISIPDPAVNSGQFTDSAHRHANDSIIPEFLDKYSDPMPILYMRANVDAPGVVTRGGIATGGPVTYQYDLDDVLGYTNSGSGPGMAIGTVSNNPKRDHHGLRGVQPQTPVQANQMQDSIMDDWKAGVGAKQGYNALAYLKDPSTPIIQPGTTSTPNTNAFASPRQKDSFILISAGADGIYGTDDDVIYPGTLHP